MLTSDSDLSTGVAELGKSSVEKSVLLPKWLDRCICMSLFCLELHIGIRDFRDRRATRVRIIIVTQVLKTRAYNMNTMASKKQKHAMAI